MIHVQIAPRPPATIPTTATAVPLLSLSIEFSWNIMQDAMVALDDALRNEPQRDRLAFVCGLDAFVHLAVGGRDKQVLYLGGHNDPPKFDGVPVYFDAHAYSRASVRVVSSGNGPWLEALRRVGRSS
jgi:hypothetical protein